MQINNIKLAQKDQKMQLGISIIALQIIGSLIVTIIMKHLNRQEIMNRRRQKRIHTQQTIEKKSNFHQCVEKQLRHVDDQTIDHLIKLAKKKKELTHEDKLDILHVIAFKTGIHLNKNTILDQISLIQSSHVAQISANWEKSRKSYFVLRGSLLLYEKVANQNKEKVYSQTNIKTFKNLYDNEQAEYSSHEEFRKYHSEYTLVEELQRFRGIGALFKKSLLQIPRRQKLVAIDAVLVQLQEYQKDMNQLFHDGISDQGKLEILYHFSALKVFGRKIKNFIKYFNVKRFSLNQTIYKAGDHSNSVYFLIKGQVKFQFQILLEKPQGACQNNRYQTPFIISTQTIGQPSYFGEEEILLKTKRTQTAKALISKCVVLEFSAQKFLKLMENSEFSSLIFRTALEKKQQREYKIEKAKQKCRNQTENRRKTSGILKEDVLRLPTQPLYLSKSTKRVHNHNNSNEKINWMHGHIVKKQPNVKTSKSSSKQKPFSMLQINPDMYEATRKKYRRFSMKTLGSQPERKWNQKNVWKVLRLEDVLRQDQVVVSSPEGRAYFDCSKRLEHHMKQTRSMRPKTTSSSYRTKLQYIAYLQRFNN